MKKRALDPNSPEVIDAVIEALKRMTSEELIAFLKWRPPGVEETDMTGQLGADFVPRQQNQTPLKPRARRAPRTAVTR